MLQHHFFEMKLLFIDRIIQLTVKLKDIYRDMLYKCHFNVYALQLPKHSQFTQLKVIFNKDIFPMFFRHFKNNEY